MVCDASAEIWAGDSYGVLPKTFKCGDSAAKGYAKYLTYFKQNPDN